MKIGEGAMNDRRTLLGALAGAAVLALAPGAAAQAPADFPNRPIRIIVP